MIELAAIKTVEWALDIDFCEACGSCLMRHSDGQTCQTHDSDCPIPALGAAILKAHHFDPGWLFDSRCQKCHGQGSYMVMRPGMLVPCDRCQAEAIATAG